MCTVQCVPLLVDLLMCCDGVHLNVCVHVCICVYGLNGMTRSFGDCCGLWCLLATGHCVDVVHLCCSCSVGFHGDMTTQRGYRICIT